MQLELGRAESELRAGTSMIVDCASMDDYDADARALFVDWHREHRKQFGSVAVITDKRLWHMLVSAMSLASGQRMRAFNDLAQARNWLDASRQ
ncbi:MAG: STAS/SEC14 domain-containing protein [Deltaproteobacteria bacterium]|nr:STAS/SEC14 domain-containing protein [Deltaproteobacteria bacterium]